MLNTVRQVKSSNFAHNPTVMSMPSSFSPSDHEGSLKNIKSPTVTLCVSLCSVLLRLNGQSEPQQRMAAVETDKELNDLLDFTAVSRPNIVYLVLPLLFLFNSNKYLL